MTCEAETLFPEPERTPEIYRKDLYRARLVIGQLRDEALASGDPFQVADLALDTAEGQACSGKRAIEGQSTVATFGSPLQEP